MRSLTRVVSPVPFLYVIFLLSGFAGLGCQLAWSRMFAPGFGHEMPASLAVVAAFMGGMGLGAWILDKTIGRSRRPAYWYAALEILIGIWGLASTVIIPLVNQAALPAIGLEPSALRHWAIAFLFPFLALLPATAAMGATLPAIERFVSPRTDGGRCVGGLYAASTLGAVSGVLASAFLLLPALGLRESVWCFAAVNLFCGAAAFRLGVAPGSPLPSQKAPVPSPDSPSSRRLGATIFITGLLGIGYEVVGIRVLSQVLENTVYTLAAVLAVFLSGLSVGAALYQRFSRSFASRVRLADSLCGLATTGLLGVLALSRSQAVYDECRNAFGDTRWGVLGAEMIVAATIFALPSTFMGALFSYLVQAARQPEGGVGRAGALNTLGGAAAPALFGVLLLPALGSKWTLVLISLGYLAIVPKWERWRWSWLFAPVSLLLLLPAQLQLTQLPPGGRLADYREGVMASVAVLEDASGQKTLRVNNHFQMGGTAAAEAEYRHAHIPLLLHPAPARALFLGLGTGITFGAAGLHPGLQSDGVELVPEVVDVMPRFEPYNYAPRQHPALTLHVADARRFIRSTQVKYDVIVADLFHPARDGAGSLYTLEHFQAARQCLAPGGLFCQWLPLHQLDDAMLRIIVRTFLEVFPNAQAYLLRLNVDAPVIGLIASLNWPTYSAEWIETRLTAPPQQKQMAGLALADSVRFFGGLIAGPKELREFCGNAPLNTDDRPRLTFGAPQFAYLKNATSYGRLLDLLDHRVTNVPQALHLGSDASSVQFAQRLTDYIKARDVYLRGLVDDAQGQPVRAIDAYVESARLSEEFTPGYAQCLTIAALEAKASPARARALLQRLVEAQPSRPVAGQMLRRLSEN